jgi:hypothetical protein
MISIRELHGADAWRYLMESVTDGLGDLREPAAITRYFTAAGTPPGWWLGSGLAGLAGGAGLAPGAVVTGEQMELLFGQGRDPVTGEISQLVHRSHREIANILHAAGVPGHPVGAARVRQSPTCSARPAATSR